jgi:hypothetical protein
MVLSDPHFAAIGSFGECVVDSDFKSQRADMTLDEGVEHPAYLF